MANIQVVAKVVTTAVEGAVSFFGADGRTYVLYWKDTTTHPASWKPVTFVQQFPS